MAGERKLPARRPARAESGPSPTPARHRQAQDSALARAVALGPARAAPTPGQDPRPAAAPVTDEVTLDLLDPPSYDATGGALARPTRARVLDGLELLWRAGDIRSTGFVPADLPVEALATAACTIAPALCAPATTTPSHLVIGPVHLAAPRLLAERRQVIDHFAFEQAGIPDRHRLALDATAVDLLDRPARHVDVEGHTDTRGAPALNLALSARRAQSVADELLRRQVDAIQIWTVRGRGATRPRFPDDADDPLAAARNRRVEINVTRMVWEATVPRPDATVQAATGSVEDDRVVWLPDQRRAVENLRGFLDATAGAMRARIAGFPAGRGMLTRDNENLVEMLALVDALVVELRAERLRIRLLAGQAGGTYAAAADTIAVRRFGDRASRSGAAADLVRGFAQAASHRTLEGLLRTAGRPVERTRDDLVRDATQARRHELYFRAMLVEMGIPVAPDGADPDLMLLFEQERSGAPRQQAEAHSGIRAAIEPRLSGETEALGSYAVRIDEDGAARLIGADGAAAPIGAVPRWIHTFSEMSRCVESLLFESGRLGALFQRPDGGAYGSILVVAFRGDERVAEFARRPESAPPRKPAATSRESLERHAVPARQFFADVWASHRVVLLGETHTENVQRRFAADMVRTHGGPDVGLALEIKFADTAELERFMTTGTWNPQSGSFFLQPEFRGILAAARATGTRVVPMDIGVHQGDRDLRMADEVEKLLGSVTRVLVYVGALHTYESGSPADLDPVLQQFLGGTFLGRRLAAKLGADAYAVELSYPPATGYHPRSLSGWIHATFPKAPSLGFDIDSTPLADRKDESVPATTIGARADGYIYFSHAQAGAAY